MSIKFITAAPPEKELTFADVKQDQFFVSGGGYLCQKISLNSYLCIANPKGEPFAGCEEGCYREMPIQRILPHVEKIEF